MKIKIVKKFLTQRVYLNIMAHDSRTTKNLLTVNSTKYRILIDRCQNQLTQWHFALGNLIMKK